MAVTINGARVLVEGDTLNAPASEAPGVPTSLGVSSEIAPYLPTGYTATATASWSAPTEMNNWTGYMLSYQETGAGAWIDVPTTSLSVTIHGLKLDQSYTFKVKTVGTGLHSVFTSTVEHTTGTHTHTPAKPVAPTITTGVRTAVIELPEHPDNDIVNYEIHFSTTGAGGTFTQVTSGANLSRVYAVNLAPTVTEVASYYYVIDAVGNTSAASDTASATVQQILDMEVATLPSGYNMLVNSDYEEGLNGWTTESGTGEVVDATGTIMSGVKMARNTTGTEWGLRNTRLMPISSQRAYILEFYVRDDAGTGGNYQIGIQQWDGTKTKIPGVKFASTGTPNATFTLVRKVFGQGLTDYLDINCRYITVSIWLNTAGAAGKCHAVQGVRIREMIESAFIEDAAITSAKIGLLQVTDEHVESLSAAKLSLTDPVNGHIKLGKASYSDTAAGFWIGNDGGVPKVHIGNSGSYHKYNGTDFEYAGKVTIKPGSSGYSNMSDKPTSLAGINSTEGTKLTGIAEGATKNTVTWGPTAPSNPQDGDTWTDTSVTPRVARSRVSGAWQASANMVTQSSHLTDAAAIQNSGVSINADGTLSGAGGGKVTIGGLGYTGALDATKNTVTISDTAPSNPTVNDMWCDTTFTDSEVWKVWTGTGWQQAGTVGAPPGTKVNGVPVATITQAVTDFNSQNNRMATAIDAPVIASDGTAIDHIINTDSSADISFEWQWTGDEGTIDGFQVFVRKSASSAAYAMGTTPAEETAYEVPASKRAFLLYSTAANQYYTFAVRAYRSVDNDINTNGYILSDLTPTTRTDESPYRPASSASFSGDIVGTVDGVSARGVRLKSAASGASICPDVYDWVTLAGHTIVTVNDGKEGTKALRMAGQGIANVGMTYAIDTARKYRARFVARSEAGTNGILYFSLRQFSDPTTPCATGLAPYYKASDVAHTDWVVYEAIWESTAWLEGVKYVRPEFLGNYTGNTGYWEVQGFSLVDVTDTIEINNATAVASTNAENSQLAAAEARQLAVTAQETAGQAILDAAAAQESATTANILLAEIADDAQITQGEKQNLFIEWQKICGEKQGILDQADAFSITTERTAYSTYFDALKDYLTAAPISMPYPPASGAGWVGNTATILLASAQIFRDRFANYYNNRQPLLNKIAQLASQRAVWDDVSDPNNTRPANNATVGATWGTNLYLIPAMVQSVSALTNISQILNSSQKLLDVQDAEGKSVFAVTENGAASATPFYAPMIQAGSVNAGWVYAGVLTGNLYQTTTTANRGIKIDGTNGMVVYDGSGNKTVEIKPDGSASFKGAIESGSTITGSTVTGGTVQTTSTANRGVKITTDGLRAYDSSGNLKAKIDSATGYAEFDDVKVRGDVEATTLKATSVEIVDTLHIKGNAVTTMKRSLFADIHCAAWGVTALGAASLYIPTTADLTNQALFLTFAMWPGNAGGGNSQHVLRIRKGSSTGPIVGEGGLQIVNNAPGGSSLNIVGLDENLTTGTTTYYVESEGDGNASYNGTKLSLTMILGVR